MAVANGVLYVGTNKTGASEIYSYDGVGSSWTKVSQSTAGTYAPSGTASIDFPVGMIAFNNALYIGTSKTGAGEIYTYSAIEGQSYQLQFGASSDQAGSTEQSGFPNLGSISFLAEQQGNSNLGIGNVTGSFLFSHGINTITGAYDVAEDYPTRDDGLEAGSLVSIDPAERGFVKTATNADPSLLIGVYSEKPALRLGQKDATIDGGRAVPIALAGRVPLRVTGDIQPGDPLTISDIPGVAKKATGTGTVVARALEPHIGSDVSRIVAFVNVSYYSSQADKVLQGGDATISSLNVSGATTLATLTVTGNASIGGKLTVASIDVGTITVAGHIITTGTTPTGEVLGAVGTGAIITIDGNDTSGTITITTGTSAISAGDLTKIVYHQAFTKTPKVILAAQDEATTDAKIFPSAKSASEFKLRTSQVLPPNTTYTFDYFIVE
jgi:hypothetical protein